MAYDKRCLLVHLRASLRVEAGIDLPNPNI
jgi:hypothetical protein